MPCHGTTRGVASGELDGASLDDGEARALVATASTPEPRNESLKRSRKTRSAILALLQVAELEADDLDEIDAVMHARLMQVNSREKLRLEQLESQASTVRGLGTGTIEAKMISNGHSAKLFGPYLYARFMEGGRYRSRYIGKPPSSVRRQAEQLSTTVSARNGA
jgi:hypothetical protein